MGRSALYVVSISFLALVFFMFFGRTLLISEVSIEPSEMLGHELPDNFEVEQSFRSQEGDILVGIHRKHELRLHRVTSPTRGITSDTAELFQQSRLYRAGKFSGTPTFFMRYISSTVDPRRTEIIEQSSSPNDLLFLKGPKKKFQALWYDKISDIIYIASHPHISISESQFVGAICELDSTATVCSA